MNKTEILNNITNYYINSHDFNGIPYMEIKNKYKNYDENDFKAIIIDLIKEKLITLNYTINPHVKQYSDFPITQQIEVLKNNSVKQIYFYPTEEHLESTLDENKYSDKPFINMLYFGKPQLEPLFFDMRILAEYSNDSYHINVISDYSGAIAYNYKDMCEKDKILLPAFELGFVNKSRERVVAASLRHLKDLSVEHQNKWMSYLIVDDECQTFCGDYHNSIFGEWVENASIYEAYIEELFHINQMSLSIFDKKLFKEDFKKNRPDGFRPLFVPNENNYNNFINVLDDMMSGNINITFFEESQDSFNNPAAHLFNEWLRKKVILQDDEDYNVIINPFLRISNIKQNLAHHIGNNNYDKKYINEQNSLLKEAYESIKAVRTLFAGHPAVRGYSVPDWLNKDDLILI